MPAPPKENAATASILSWEVLEKSYPAPDGTIAEGCASYENQCSIRMSEALHMAGFPLSNYSDPVCIAHKARHARGAESLAKHLQKTLKKTVGPPRVLHAPKHSSALAGKRGIVFSNDITGFRGGIGDQIDLWDGTKTKGYNGFGVSKQVWFWELK